MPKNTNASLSRELESISFDISQALNQADDLLRRVGGIAEARARRYWFAQMRIALDDGHGYLADASTTMQATIDEIRERDTPDPY